MSNTENQNVEDGGGTAQGTPPRIDLRVEDHNGHMNSEKEGFDPCVPIMVHCRSKAEARAVASHITDMYGGDSSE